MFDRIPRGNIWQALNTYGIPMDLQRAIESTYKVCKSKVNTHMGGGGKWFDTKCDKVVYYYPCCLYYTWIL